MNEEEKEAIKEVKEIINGDYEYPSILNEIMKTNYGNKDLIELWNATDDESSNYEEYTDLDIAKAIVYLVNLIEKQQKEIEELNEDNNALEIMFDTANEREYRKKYIEERRKEQPNLYCPDFDEIYERYYKQKTEIEQLKEDYQILKDDIEGHRIVYVDTPEFEEIYISKDKIKGKIEELKNKKIGASTGIFAVQVDILEELLGE